MTKVSVIIPTYNRAESLQVAIRSVLDQTFQDFELIVVDDASRDNTADAVEAFKDDRIRYIRHTVNKGESGTRNTGVLNSKGQYIAFLDDDDEWLPEKLEKQVALLDKSPAIVGGIYTGIFTVHKASGKIIRQRVPKKRGYIFQDMIAGNYVRTPTTVLVRKQCFEKIGLFDENLAFGTDYDMWLRIAKEYHFECIQEPLAKYYIHDDKMSTNQTMRIKGLETTLKKHGPLFALCRKAYSRRYRALGALYGYANDLPKARKAFISAIRAYPFEIRNYLYLALSFVGAKNFVRLTEMRKEIGLRKFHASSRG